MTDAGGICFDSYVDSLELAVWVPPSLFVTAVAVVVDVQFCFVSVFCFSCSIRNLYRVPAE